MLQAKTKEQRQIIKDLLESDCRQANSVLSISETSFEADLHCLTFETMAKITDYLRIQNYTNNVNVNYGKTLARHLNNNLK